MSTNKFLYIALIIGVLFISPVLTVSAQTTQCLSLQSDLGYGMSDYSSNTNGIIILLQEYLAKAGYLSATPNGYFGPATLAAVESFQSANGISNTGYVGPLTRAALGRLACTTVNNVMTASPVQTQTTPTTISTTPTISTISPAVSTSIITAPTGGQTLITGQAFNITWNSQPYSRYNLVLVSSSGAGAGFIAQSVGSVNQYIWTIGDVFSSQTQSNIIVPAGSYQIRMENVTTGAEPTDPISNPFNISAATLNLSYVFPTSAPADGNTAVVLYGSDFSMSTVVNFTGTNTKGQVLYASPDGRVLVFSVPTGIYPSSQSVYVSNSSNQSSNQLPFNITSQ
jgi:peptidoglycan hydrolase-like protein with peptidoglycan-binding domain